MTDTFKTIKAKLVTLIMPYEFGEQVAIDLRALGVSGYTITKADGWGREGPRQSGIIDGANLRLEALVTAELANEMLHHIVARFDQDGVVAFMQDVEAIPHRHR